MPFTIEFARGKADRSAISGRSSASLNDSYQNNPALWGGAINLGYNGPLLPARGALPFVMNGVLVGAMGASGAPSQEDENAAAAAWPPPRLPGWQSAAARPGPGRGSRPGKARVTEQRHPRT